MWVLLLTVQIITNFPSVLNIHYPAAFDKVVQDARFININLLYVRQHGSPISKPSAF